MWGGRRKGAGRKPALIKKITFSVKVTEEEKQAIKNLLADMRNEAVSRKEEVTKMKIKELKECLKGQYTDIDVYKFVSGRKTIHTDNIIPVDENEDDVVAKYELMSKEEYSSTILANSSLSWEDMYKDDVILVIIVE